ncbi:MAG: N-glycosylase/DNA lyase [Candidatus Aenigmarchaeota archaeon]|nr:N-glycosylase/DNA lyase [Candidatus Aenigmarchaeota archaeon]
MNSIGRILSRVRKLKNSKVRNIIDFRMKEFEHAGKMSGTEIFKELCFCLLTANFNAERSIKIQKEIGDGFITLHLEELSEKLASFGHRYPNARAAYIFEARKHKDTLKENLEGMPDDFSAREWLVCNVKGLGYKEASHFLRNIGRKNLAIIDFHIVDILAENKLIEPPKSKCLTKKKYLEIEEVLRAIGQKAGLNPAELDLYLWYMETGKVLK